MDSAQISHIVQRDSDIVDTLKHRTPLHPLRLVDWSVRFPSLEKLDHVRHHLIQDLRQEVCRRRSRMRGDQLAARSVGGVGSSLKDGLTALGLDLSAGWISGSLSKTSRATRMTKVIGSAPDWEECEMKRTFTALQSVNEVLFDYHRSSS